MLTKDFFSRSFHSCKLFHKRVSCTKNETRRQFDRIKNVFKIWFNRSEKNSIVDVRLCSKYPFVSKTFHLTFFRRLQKVYNLQKVKGAIQGLRQFLALESPLKMMKNVFYFTLEKLFLFSRYLSFCLDFFGHV